MNVVVTRTDADGAARAGWRVVPIHSAAGFVDQLVREGEEARAGLPPSSPRHREIGAWVSALRLKPYVPAGNYPLRGKAAVHVEHSTEATRAAARARSEMADAVNRARLLPGSSADDARERRLAMHQRLTAGFEKSEARRRLGI